MAAASTLLQRLQEIGNTVSGTAASAASESKKANNQSNKSSSDNLYTIDSKTGIKLSNADQKIADNKSNQEKRRQDQVDLFSMEITDPRASALTSNKTQEVDAVMDALGMNNNESNREEKAAEGNEVIAGELVPSVSGGEFLAAYNAYRDANENFANTYANPYQFMTEGTDDDWLNFVMDESIRPYYSAYEDQYGSFDDVNNFYTFLNDPLDNITWESGYTDNGQYFDMLGGNDAQMLAAINEGWVDASGGYRNDYGDYDFNELANYGYIPPETSLAYETIDDEDLNRQLANYILGYRLLQSGLDENGAIINSLLDRGFDPDELNALFTLDDMALGAQGDNAEYRYSDDTLQYLSPDIALQIDPEAWSQYGIPVTMMPDLYTLNYPEYGVRSKR